MYCSYNYYLNSISTNPYIIICCDSRKNYLSWLDEKFVTVLYATDNDDDDNGNNWEFASTPYIHQVRVFNHQCPTEKYASLIGKQRKCLSVRYETGNFKNSWNKAISATERNYALTQWTSTKPNRSHPFIVGNLDRYPSNGYYVWLPSNITYRDRSMNELSDLKKNLWFDSNTRLLKHTAVLYNKNINMYAYYNLLVERLESGYMSALYTVSYFQADFYLENVDRFSIFCVVLLFVIMVGLTVKTLLILNKHGLWSSLKRFWCLHLIVTVFFTLMAIAIHVVNLIQMNAFTNDIHNGRVAIGSNIIEVETLNNLSRYMFSVSLFLIRSHNCHFLNFTIRLSLY